MYTRNDKGNYEGNYEVNVQGTVIEFTVYINQSEYTVTIESVKSASSVNGVSKAHVKSTINGEAFEFDMREDMISEPYDVAKCAAYKWHFEH